MKGSMNDIWETRIRKEKVQKRKEKIKNIIKYEKIKNDFSEKCSPLIKSVL